MGHTPEWEIAVHESWSEWYGNIIRNLAVVDGIQNIRTVACLTKYGTVEEQRENAKFISLALNSHAALKAALERYVSKFGNCGDVYEAARSALAIAGGESQ